MRRKQKTIFASLLEQAFFCRTPTYDGRGFAGRGLGSGLNEVGKVLFFVEDPGAGQSRNGGTFSPRRQVGEDGPQDDDEEEEGDLVLEKKSIHIV